jgi:DNA-binding GntR family transcriptional regulator
MDATTDAVALHVEQRGIEPAQLFEVRGAVEMAVLDRVFVNLNEAGVARLHEELDAERSATREEFGIVGHDLHGVLAEVGGNRVLELLTLVLLRLTRHHQARPEGAADPRTDPVPSREVIRAHKGIVDAIVARDRELARHRMRRHLDALRLWVR